MEIILKTALGTTLIGVCRPNGFELGGVFYDRLRRLGEGAYG
jgi:hypothetical protein